jgi:RNA polymerase sigma factor (sigma-70 family)
MANLSLQKIAAQLRRVSVLPGGVDLTDGQLLAQFIGQHDEAAFAAFVKRHGSMVLGVCRRLLGNVHDADDAFQATFMILVHKAASLKSCELLGNWLYGVAYNTALAARAKRCRRQSKEKQVLGMPEPVMSQPDDWSDLRPLLDQELSQLAGYYREAIVLCDLEGISRKQAARQLAIPESTLSGRLTTARRQLAKRLARHGITLSVGALATVLSQCAVSARVPMPLVASTVKAATTVAAGSATAVVSASAVTLTKGVLKTMFLTKVKTVSAFVLAFLLPSGVVLVGLAQSAPLAAQAGDTKEKRAQIEEAIKAQDADELAKLRKENELLKKEIELLKKGAKAQPDGAVDPKIAKELDEADAVKLVEKLGGKITRDDQQPGKPVVEVDLQVTRVTDADLKDLKGLKKLTTLNLFGCKGVTDAGVKELKELKQLTSLYLYRSQVTEAGVKELKDLKQLTRLILGGAQGTNAGLKELKDLKQLTELRVIGSPVTNAGLKELKDFKSLTKLDISGCKALTDAGLKELKDLNKQLTDLDLNNTKVTDAGLKEVKELTQLTRLALGDTQVTDAGLKELKELKQLTTLNLRSAKVTDAGVKELQEALPKCKISR